jgi:aminoglycoside phosphotransferase (APT) family kinase protein
VDRRYAAAAPTGDDEVEAMTNPGDDAATLAKQLALTLEHRLAGGAFGAHRARTAGGDAVVFKVLPDHPGFSPGRVARAVELAATMRANGCPVPRFLGTGNVDGRVYTIQEFVAGEAPAVLRLPHAEQLVRVWQRFAGAAEAAGTAASTEGRARAEDIVTGLRTGTERVFIDHAVLRQAPDPRVRAVLDLAVEIGHSVEPATFRFGDVVHGDFDHSNVLVDGDRVVAVFDWEGAHTGDSRIDIMSLATVPGADQVEPAAARFLAATVAEAVPDGVRRAVLALGALQRLTFAVRTRPDLLEWALSTTTGLTGPQR